ncbi:MAG: hypothetical protein ACFE89_09905 [Candidatus Hodarchaeota archaeon]
MEDIMKNLTKTTEKLGTWTTILNYWTIITIIILVAVITGHFFDPFLFPQLLSLIGTPVYLICIIIPLFGVFMIKDTQLRILLSIVRGILGFLLPLILTIITFLFFPTNFSLIGLFVLLLIVSLIIGTFILLQTLALNNLTKQLLKAAIS